MFQHILCPTDMKERSGAALEIAVQMAHRHGSRITLLNAHDEFLNKEERSMLRVSIDDMKEKYRQAAVKAREEMKAQVAEACCEDLEIHYVLREGKAEKAIVKAAADLGADLVVICTDGRDNIRDYVSGTISEYVINHAPCPVLVVPYQNP